MSVAPEKKSKKIIRKLTDKYRLVIMDETTFEERLSFNLTRFNVLVLFSVLAIVFSLFIYAIIIFTPLKEYIPGYGDVSVRKEVLSMKSRADSLETVMQQQSLWMQNVKNLLEGNLDSVSIEKSAKQEFFDTIKLDKIPIEDVLLREAIEREEGYALLFADKEAQPQNTIYNLNFFPPLKGYVTATFNAEKEHYGIDIAAQENTPILATLDGTVIFAGWTLETGYVIGLQHSQNVVSYYKHNSVILKKLGNFVKAGEPIAIIGNTGELTDGPHVHFELWKDGIALNPENYLVF